MAVGHLSSFHLVCWSVRFLNDSGGRSSAAYCSVAFALLVPCGHGGLAWHVGVALVRGLIVASQFGSMDFARRGVIWIGPHGLLLRSPLWGLFLIRSLDRRGRRPHFFR